MIQTVIATVTPKDTSRTFHTDEVIVEKQKAKSKQLFNSLLLSTTISTTLLKQKVVCNR